jgi:chaperonin GroEL (HSP60 family)
MLVKDMLEDGKMLAGGGASEIEMSLRLHKYAASQGGRQQLVIEAFASALEVIPRARAENSGLDPINMIVALRAAHCKGDIFAGLDVSAGKPSDMRKAGVLEPLRVKTQAVASAADAAIMILRIDDVSHSQKLTRPARHPAAREGCDTETWRNDAYVWPIRR